MNNLAFQLRDAVIITASGEQGEVASRSESTFAEPQYLVRYRANDGRAVEQWWSQSALKHAESKVSCDTVQVRQLTDGCAMTPEAPRLHHVVAAALADKLNSRKRVLASLSEALVDANVNRNHAEKQIEEVAREIAALEEALGSA